MSRIAARRLPQHLGPAAWNAILPPDSAATPLDTDQTADIAIIGAGFAGLSTARRLTQLDPSLKIAVLDAGRVAEGAAGRNSGFMIDLPHDLTSEDYAGAGDDRKIIALNRTAQNFAADMVDEFNIDTNFFDRAGKINGAVGASAETQNATYARHLESLGEKSERLDRHAMAEITGSTYYSSGLFTPGTVILQPAGYVRGVLDGLIRNGVSVFENTAVTALNRQNQTWRLSTPNAQLSVKKVILTVNGHLESFGFEPDRLMQIFLFASMTPELSTDQIKTVGGHARWGITPSDPMGTTVRRIDAGQGGHRIVTRTCATLNSDMTPKPADLSRAARTMQTKFDQRFPHLEGLEPEYTWSGHLCLSRNAVSVVKELEPGLFSGCVQNGLGTARGTLTGIAAAELAYGTKSKISDHFASEQRPTKLPPKPFRDIGANLTLRWKEWRARNE